MDSVKVAAGILQKSDGRILLTERLGDSPFAGLWEFPGGKIIEGESPAAALRRELEEELGIDIDQFEHFMSVDHHYANRHVSIEFFMVTRWRSHPRGLDGQAMRWVDPGLLDNDQVLPADVPVLDALRDQAAAIRKY